MKLNKFKKNFKKWKIMNQTIQTKWTKHKN